MRFVILCIILMTCLTAKAQDYNNITLLDNWMDDQLVTANSKNRYNDCWGFVYKNVEYAVAGSTEGTHFFQISDHNKLVQKDFVRARFSSASVVHRDFKTYKNYLYSVCDEGSSSLQIIDFQALPDSVNLVADIEPNFGRIHNIFIDTSDALLYAFGVTEMSGGLPVSTSSMKVYSLANPILPVQVFGGFDDMQIVHDGVVRNNIAYLSCGFDGFRRYDFTNPANPVFLQNLPTYQDQGYNHQGDVNPAGNVYIFGDETNGKKLKKCTIGSNGNISIQSFFGTNIVNNSVPHNIMLDDRFAYVAYYNEGLRVFDYQSKPVEEIAFYDTYPDNSEYKLNGLWGIYTKLPSGRILASDRKYGLFLFDFNREIFSLRSKDEFQIYPNPVQKGQNLSLFINQYLNGIVRVKIYDMTGRIVHETDFSHQNFAIIQANLESGNYLLKGTFMKNSSEKEFVFQITVF